MTPAVQVFFKRQKAQNLSSLRRVTPHRTLHVRPIGRVKRTEVGVEAAGFPDTRCMVYLSTSWKAKCPIFKAIVAGFRGKVAFKKN